MPVTDRLKDEGNAYYTAGNFMAAYEKYTEAIHVEGQPNAVLFANRAACSISMEKYLDAAEDAKKATQLDPKYSKAWGRLATAFQALGLYSAGIEAWEKALATLPTGGDLSATDKKLKEQFEQGLKTAQDANDNLNRKPPMSVISDSSIKQGDLPWDRALALRPELEQNPDMAGSSAWVIMFAYKDWLRGCQDIKSMKRYELDSGLIKFEGQLHGISHLTNALLRDPRVFHMNREWQDTFNLYMEAVQSYLEMNDWTGGGTDHVTEAAQKKLNESGWDTVRPFISLIVRLWTFRSFIEETAFGNVTSAIQLCGQVIEVLEWGRKVWRNVPQADRGAVFDVTFLRGVKRLYLSIYTSAYTAEPDVYPLEGLLDMANAMIQEVGAGHPEPGTAYDPGFISSFWLYPLAEALTVKAFYHTQMALLCGVNIDAAQEHLTEAYNFYLEAAELFPDDDEKHVYFLGYALQALWRRGTPLKETLPLCARIRETVPKMTRIWELSPLAKSRDEVIGYALSFEKDALEGLEKGKVKLDDEAKPVSTN